MHALDGDGMVACNPRDREAAHRAQMGGVATGDPAAVTCAKCRAAMRAKKSGGTRDRIPPLGSS